MDLIFHKDFLINSQSLKLIRNFSRETFVKINTEEILNQQEEIILAIAEAAQNILKHAYHTKFCDEKLKIKITKGQDKIQIDLFDKGKKTDPEKVKSRELGNVRPGGLGVYFIKQIMDKVEFISEDNSEWVNHLVLTKYIR